ncbi:TATA-box binding protein [Halorhabdus tiamatea SARL4B]|uniref:TATA-box binding protein n=1 Tax=Halorhabdus tiamatea SARL4B TaxID=1033806 RepID=S6D175_9EURY|nr:TATA-box binding protein [Halorhabdus tiamatea SARL4B]
MVGSGEFDLELDLEVLARDLGDVAEYDPDGHTGMHIRLSNGALVTLYRTGSYHIVGIESEQGLTESREELIERLQRLEIQFDPSADGFGVRNIVCTGDYGEAVNLNALTIGLGLENVEYEPEQFPGLVYRPEGFDAVVLVFASGKLVITGLTTLNTASQVLDSVSADISELLP